ncbi:prepilin peptidase [bacterium]|nr:prepilin peptidase [bacterium]
MMIEILLIILGLAIGSFLNVCIYRLPKHVSISKPRSHCLKCDNQLKPWENIPVLSYIFLRGKCSNCHTPISLRYPFIEILTSIIFLLLYYYYGLTIQTLLLCVLFSIVIVITFIDVDTQLISNELLIFGLIPVSIYIVLPGLSNIGTNLLGAIGLSGLFFLIGYFGKILYKEDSMGMGDIKYAFVIGLLLGWKSGILAFGISFLSAAIIIFIYSITKNLKPRQKIPFGPFMSIGLLIALIWGEKIIEWYLLFYK